MKAPTQYRRPAFAVATLALVLSLGTPAAHGQEQANLFDDITDAALGSAPFVHAGATVDASRTMRAVGWLGGVAIADLNGDGWADIFVTNGRGGANALYLNNADAALTFTEVAALAGVDFPGDEAAGVTAGDVDNDGQLDLYVTNVGLDFGPPSVQAEGPNRLLRNLGNDGDGVPRFTDVGGVTGAAGDPFTRSQSPNLVDFDRDGDLDVYVGAHNPVVFPLLDSESPLYPFKRPDSRQSLLLKSLLKETGSLTFDDATDLLRQR